jgi:CRP-like cAMP-binding protein
MNPEAERLSRIPLFDGLSDERRAELAAWFEVGEFEAGKRLTHEGSVEYGFLVLDEGRARVERDGQVLKVLEAGDVFGEMAFFSDGRRNADVVAETDVTVLWMFGTRFREMQTSMPEIAARLEELVRERGDGDSEISRT